MYYNSIDNYPHPIRKPYIEELPNTVIYRNVVGLLLHYLQWERVGGPRFIRPEKIRNDIIDVNIATYATYFDGILSNDYNLCEIFDGINVIIDDIKHNIENMESH